MLLLAWSLRLDAESVPRQVARGRQQINDECYNGLTAVCLPLTC